MYYSNSETILFLKIQCQYIVFRTCLWSRKLGFFYTRMSKRCVKAYTKMKFMLKYSCIFILYIIHITFSSTSENVSKFYFASFVDVEYSLWIILVLRPENPHIIYNALIVA